MNSSSVRGSRRTAGDGDRRPSRARTLGGAKISRAPGSAATALYRQRRLVRVSQAPSPDGRRLPGRRRRVRGVRAPAAPGLHAGAHARALRHRRAAAHRSSSSRSSSCAWAWTRPSSASTTSTRTRAARPRRPHGDRLPSSPARPPRCSSAPSPGRSASSCSATRRRTLMRHRRPGPLGVHQPRARLRAAARRRARPALPDRLDDQRALTIGLTVGLVVFARRRRPRPAAGQLRRLRRGAARPVVACFAAAWRAVGPRAQLPPMLRFGLPTVPAEVSVFLLNVVDRFYLFRVGARGRAAGLYSLAVKFAAVVILRRARVPVRVAAAGLLGQGRPRGLPRSTPPSRPTTCSSPG